MATRGFKTRFQEGEIVLCYEPDPNKAKVLYEAKVLEVVLDGKGKRNVAYLIHFQGWNSSWDRCVGEDYILQDNEHNRNLQRQLADKANLLRENKTKRRRRLSELIAECSGSETGSNKGKGDSESEEEVEKMGPVDMLAMPDSLKAILDKDCHKITSENLLLRLPASFNCVQVLEKFLCHFASSQLYPQTDSRRKHDHSNLDVVRLKIQLCKEMIDGVRTLLDYSNCLLYAEEREHSKQFLCVKQEGKSENSGDKEEPRVLRGRPRKDKDDQHGKKEDSQSDKRKLRSHDNTQTPQEIKEVVETEPPEKIHIKCSVGAKCSCSQILNDVQNWHLYLTTPSPPRLASLLYPPILLLRLYVKLPEVLKGMSMPSSKLRYLLRLLNTMLHFLEDKQQDFFSDKYYTT